MLGASLNRVFKLPSGVRIVKRSSEAAGTPPHFDWSAIAERFLWEDGNRTDEKESRQGVFHPSGGIHPKCGACPRAHAFELLSAPLSPMQIPAKILKVFSNGKDRHKGLQELFEKMAKAGFMGIDSAEREVHCTHHSLPISGHADLILSLQGHFYVFDFKTWSSINCSKTFEPKFEHRVQLITYMGIKGIKAGYMIYENKDTQEWLGPMKRFRVDFDPKLFGEIEEYCASIYEGALGRQLPEFETAVCNRNKKFCAYTEICDRERAGKITWSVDPRKQLPVIQ